jgi:guanosine-3',5'-bis(diphosphate) 3'-pyrophosphohydrolase
MRSRIYAARAFAYAAHLGQKYGGAHYITHLDHATDVLRRFDISEQTSPEIFEATYLHDTIEDTAVKAYDIAVNFTPEVAFLVEAVTDQEGENRAERHARTYPRIRAAGWKAVVVKLADRIANVETSVRGPNEGKLSMYRKEYEEFRDALWLPGMGSPIPKMWEHLDGLLGWKRE